MRLPLHSLLFLTIALLTTLPASAQTAAATPPQLPPSLQNQVIVRADGSVYLVRDGTRHLITPVSLSDDDVAAIPEGPAYSNGLVPIDALTALIGGAGSPSVTAAAIHGTSILAPASTAPPPTPPSAPPSAPPPAPAPAPTAPGPSTSSAATSPSTVHVTLNEWNITPDATSVAAGKVTFDVSDAGKGEHEMVLFKSDKDPSSLPASRGKVDESAIGQKIGEVEGLRAGDDKSATFDVKPGTYSLICNLTNHYSKGMVSQIEVK